MKLTIFNGSPRNKKSNSLILINKFLQGYNSVVQDPITVHHLASRKRRNEHLDAFMEAGTILLFFPLYTDAMPGIVKEFFEEIATLGPNLKKRIGFVVQSGFRESIHSFPLERYLHKLTNRLHHEYLGTVIRGGLEGIQIMPPVMTKKLFDSFYRLGVRFSENSVFDKSIMEDLRKPYRLSGMQKISYRFLKALGLTNYYWNMNLKKNGAYEKRFDRPYIAQ